MKRRELFCKILACAILLSICSPALAAAPGAIEGSGWLDTLYSRVMQWWLPVEAEDPGTERTRGKVEQGQVTTMDGGPVCEPGMPDPGTERTCAGDPDG